MLAILIYRTGDSLMLDFMHDTHFRAVLLFMKSLHFSAVTALLRGLPIHFFFINKYILAKTYILHILYIHTYIYIHTTYMTNIYS